MILNQNERDALDKQIELQFVFEQVKKSKEYHRLDRYFHHDFCGYSSVGQSWKYNPVQILELKGQTDEFCEPALFTCAEIEPNLVKIEYTLYDQWNEPKEKRTSLWIKEREEFKQLRHYLKNLKANQDES